MRGRSRNQGRGPFNAETQRHRDKRREDQGNSRPESAEAAEARGPAAARGWAGGYQVTLPNGRGSAWETGRRAGTRLAAGGGRGRRGGYQVTLPNGRGSDWGPVRRAGTRLAARGGRGRRGGYQGTQIGRAA